MATENTTPRLKICLAASGGGHLRQLLDLEPVWSQHDYYFVTEDTALGASLAESHPVHFVPHVALGQAKLGSPLKMLGAAWRSLIQSARIIFAHRPDVVISTGAGAVFFAVLWARLIGAKLVVIESFARFDRPSAFGKLAAPLAHHHVVQSQALAAFYPKAKVFDPLRILDGPRPEKKPLLFATSGATLPFDRMVRTVSEAKAAGAVPEDVIIQTGLGGLVVDGVETFETLPYARMNELLKEADIVVCHGGTGSLITALRQGCRVVAMPRLYERGEHYDNHQAEITTAFAQRGLLEVANSTEEMIAALERVRARTPIMATTEPAELIAFLNTILDNQARQDRPAVAGYATIKA